MMNEIIQKGKDGCIQIGTIKGNITIQTHQLTHKNEPEYLGRSLIERAAKDALNWFQQNIPNAVGYAYPLSHIDNWEFESISESENNSYYAIFDITFSLESLPFGTHYWRIQVEVDKKTGEILNIADVRNTCPLEPCEQHDMIKEGFNEISKWIDDIFS
jgi:hypothetical protein